MRRRDFTAGALAMGASACQRPQVAEDAAPAPPDLSEHASTIEALRPPKRARPLVVILADPDGAETTDLIIPYAVLQRSGLCDLRIASSLRGRTQLRPALAIDAGADLDEILSEAPDGPDYLIVPALRLRDAAAPVAFIRQCSERGAVVAGICAGALTLEAAGLLSERRATTHWWDVEALAERNPAMTWVRDRRYVVDRGVATTTGVSASLPFSLALVEAIGGRKRAAALAAELGAESWDARHDSSAFRRRGAVLGVAAANTLAFWERETIGVEVNDGVDEIALAFTADAWSRTYRSKSLAVGTGAGPVRARSGLIVHREREASDGELDLVVAPAPEDKPALALAAALGAIAQRHGVQTAALVALQLEYPWLE
ncbi:MAG TPA: DJ-1/PfpI family protein [Vitreimonas sp.]|uniref:DJ-1/PfpI family protein n=1 Tax=Vitreimonas sp. TaxID=3069702 RepID=UPI002D6068E3|nr:DJ-1/PfpI family protein [Vitreimonas sp.]HYD86929.1 DJ-1/PfpI family protein [Vitreimonas sp.]